MKPHRAMVIYRFAFLVALFLGTSVGAEVSVTETATVRISGKITEETAAEFRSTLERNPGLRVIELDSPGGLVYPALAIAKQAHAAKLNTRVLSENKCFSACSLIFLSGSVRIADGELGVHQVSGVDEPSLTQSALSDIYELLTVFNTPDKLIAIMLRTPPEDMYIFTSAELERFGINVRSSQTGTVDFAHLEIVNSTIFKDWLVGKFLNNHIAKPFLAMESRAMDPVFRIVHYPHSLNTFLEIIWDDPKFESKAVELEFVFQHPSGAPYRVWVPADAEANGFSADIPSDGDSAQRLFLTALTHGSSLIVNDATGKKIAAFSLAGSGLASEEFGRLIFQAHGQ